MEKKINEVKEFYLSRVKNYEVALNYEKSIYGKISEIEKIELEIKRIFLKLRDNSNLYNKVLTYYYEIVNLYSDYRVMPTKDKLYDLKQKIVNLQIICGIKVGMISFIFEESQKNVEVIHKKENKKYIDKEYTNNDIRKL